MSNIKTRKGLAFGALVALGASLIAGAPAHAAGEVNVVPSAGSLLSTLSTETFTLKSNLTSNNNTPQNIADIRYQVKSTSAINAETWQGNGNSDVYQLLTTTTDHKIDFAATGAASALNYLALSAADTTKAASVEVTTYVDADNSGSFTAGEFNNVQTITFKKLADVAAAVNLDTPHADDTTVTGQVTLDGINLSQIQSTISVDISNYDSTASQRVYYYLNDVVATAGTLKFSAGVNALVAGDNIAARAFIGEYDRVETAPFAAATKKVVAHTVGDLDATVVAGPNATGGSSSEVRANSPFVVTATVHDKDHTLSDAVAVAGATVNATFTSSRTLDATHTVTINGTTYTTDADLAAATLKLTSGANGSVSLNVTTVGFAAGDILSFFFESEHYTADAYAEVAALHYYVFDAADKLNNNARSAVAGSTTNVTYTVLDQFGQAPANGKLALQVEGDSITTAHVDVVNGSVTVPVAVAATPAIAQTDVEATLYEYSTNEHSFVSAAPAANTCNEDGFTLYVAPSNEITAATIALTKDTADGSYTLDSTDKFASVDGRFSGFYGFAATPDHNGDAVAFHAVVKAGDVATHTIAGAPVTISAPGLLIENEAGQFGVGTLTVLADASGYVDFEVYSHKSGTADVTVTSGAASATKTASKWAPLAATTISSVVASASYTSGRVVLVEFTSADKYGNASAVTGTATVAGAGYLVGASSSIGQTVTLTTGADGKGAVQLVNGADQIGTATVTASISYGDPVVTKTAASAYTFGQTDANLNISGKRVTADWVFAAGKTVTITRDGVTIRTFHPTANSADSFSFNLKKSKRAHRVTIKVNGVTITDAGYLVKK